jgi:hypothetical protein
MRASEAMAPLEFRFTDPDDVEKYGDRWYWYSEADLIRRPARELVALEAELGMPIAQVMNGMRMSSVLGDMATTWISVRDTDPALAGKFSDYNPLTMLVEWRAAVDEGKAEGTTETEDPPKSPDSPDSGSPTPGPSRPETSGQTDIVTLSTLPVVG